MKLNDDEQVLYDFFCQIAVVDNSVDYPLILLNAWANGERGIKQVRRWTDCGNHFGSS